MSDDGLMAWLRKVAPAHKEGTSRGFAFNMDGLCLQELNAKINEAATRLESLLSDKAKLEERVREIGAAVRSAALDALRQFPEAEEAIFPAVASATYAALNNKSGQ